MHFALCYLKKRRWIMFFGASFFIWSVTSTKEHEAVLRGLVLLVLASGLVLLLAVYLNWRQGMPEERREKVGVVVPAWLGVVLALAALGMTVRFLPPAREVIGGAAVGALLAVFARGFWASLVRPTIWACAGNLLLVAFATAVIALFAEMVGENDGSILMAFVGVAVGGTAALVALRKS